MTFSAFRELIAEVKRLPRMRLCVAAATDETVMRAVKNAVSEGIVDPILVGDVKRMWRICLKISLHPGGIRMINETNPVEAARLAAGLVGAGEADVLMKGMINSSDFLRAVLRNHPHDSNERMYNSTLIFCGCYCHLILSLLFSLYSANISKDIPAIKAINAHIVRP
ncbi:MAG: hypothetical protein K6T66_15545 [Peptococcaceae bacterium]|nr:hypothetical protein [Peptococcaceae bacterium]